MFQSSPWSLVEPALKMPPSLIQRTELATAGDTGFRGLLRRFVTIVSNSTQLVGLLLLLQPATSMPLFAISVGTIMEKPSPGSLKDFVFGLVKPCKLPLILTLYQVT